MLNGTSLTDGAAAGPTGMIARDADSMASRWRRRWPVTAGVVLLAALLVAGVVQQGSTGVGTGPLAGAVAPDFTLATFDGRTFQLRAQRGHPVVVNFWASWCPPCRAEAAALARIAQVERAAGRAVFVGVDVRDDEEQARRFLADFSVPYANGPDPGTLEASYLGMGIPYTVFVAADGTVARTWIGPLDEQRLTAIIDEIA